MSEEVANSGWLARAAGIPALKLWPETFSASFPMWGLSSWGRRLLTCLLVRQTPVENLKTGESGSGEPKESFKRDSAATGQTEWPVKLKMSTYSPLGSLDFGVLMWTRMCEVLLKLRSRHKRVSSGEKEFSFCGRISPILKHPKKARVKAAHTVCLLFSVQFVFEILWPVIFNKLRVITFLVAFASPE